MIIKNITTIRHTFDLQRINKTKGLVEMSYEDDKLLSIEEYEKMALAYSKARKNSEIFLKVEEIKNQSLIDDIFDDMAMIRTCLFNMAGFLNTSRLYSLNERQIKKMRVIFDYEKPLKTCKIKRDKTLNFLCFIGKEASLIKHLIDISTLSSFEQQLLNIINDRLSLISEIFR